MTTMQKALIFQPAFGEQWSKLPPVLHKHYANRSHSRDTVVMQGTMQFEASRMARLLSPLMRLSGMVPMFTAKDVPATVQMASQPDKSSLAFHRVFNVPGRKPLTFLTEMEPMGGSRFIDWTRDDIGWHMEIASDENGVTMSHCGYYGRLFGKIFRLPLEWLIGTCNAWEKVEGDNHFSMRMEIRRRNGKLFYTYSGEFQIAGVMRRS